MARCDWGAKKGEEGKGPPAPTNKRISMQAPKAGNELNVIVTCLLFFSFWNFSAHLPRLTSTPHPKKKSDPNIHVPIPLTQSTFCTFFLSICVGIAKFPDASPSSPFPASPFPLPHTPVLAPGGPRRRSSISRSASAPSPPPNPSTG